MMQQIKMVTYCVESLGLNIDAWQHYLGYRIIEQGKIPEELANLWGAKNVAGKPFAIIEPSSGEAVWIRFIETGKNFPFQQPLYEGWNATEILVENPDELAKKLRDGPFRLIGGPHDLYDMKKSPRAIQVLGPSGEMLYFSRLLPGGSRYGLKGAKSFVDRTFNVIVGGTKLSAMERFYKKQLGLRTYQPISFTIPMLANVCGISSHMPFTIQIAKIAGRRFIIELDQYPSHIKPRPRRKEELPPGMSMVSFNVNSLDSLQLDWRNSPTVINAPGYHSQKAAVTVGAAGEWVELIEK
jgi:hypothetical protein